MLDRKRRASKLYFKGMHKKRKDLTTFFQVDRTVLRYQDRRMGEMPKFVVGRLILPEFLPSVICRYEIDHGIGMSLICVR